MGRTHLTHLPFLPLLGVFSVVRFQEVANWQALHTGRTEEGYARCGMMKCLKACLQCWRHLGVRFDVFVFLLAAVL